MTGDLLPIPYLAGILQYPFCYQLVPTMRFAMLSLFTPSHSWYVQQRCHGQKMSAY